MSEYENKIQLWLRLECHLNICWTYHIGEKESNRISFKQRQPSPPTEWVMLPKGGWSGTHGFLLKKTRRAGSFHPSPKKHTTTQPQECQSSLFPEGGAVWSDWNDVWWWPHILLISDGDKGHIKLILNAILSNEFLFRKICQWLKHDIRGR